MDFCQNAYEPRLTLPSYDRLAIAIPNLVLIPFTIVANGLLLVSIVKTNQHRKTSCLLICCLGCSDFLMALVAQPCVAVLFLKYMNTRNCQLSATCQFLILFSGHLSAMFVIAVSLDRFIHMRYPYSYKTIMTERRSYYLIAMCILCALSMAMTYTLGSYFKVYVVAHLVVLALDTVFITTIFTAYTATYVQVRHHVLSTQSLRNIPGDKNKDTKGNDGKPKYALKTAKTIFLILTAVCICYTPYVIVSIVWCGLKLSGKTPGQAYELSLYLLYIVVYLNSGLNAVIFLNGNKACKDFLRQRVERYIPTDNSTTGSADTEEIVLRESGK